MGGFIDPLGAEDEKCMGVKVKSNPVLFYLVEICQWDSNPVNPVNSLPVYGLVNNQLLLLLRCNCARWFL